jgi:GINS complex subunit 2
MFWLLYLQLKNVSAMEVNRMRNFTMRALQSFYKHDSEDLVKQTGLESDSQTTSTSSEHLPRVHIQTPQVLV